MEIPLKGWAQTPATTKMATASRWSYFSATLPGRWICRKRMQDRRVARAWKKLKFEPRHRQSVSGRFSSIAIMLIHFMCLFCSWWEFIICNVAACIWWCLLYLNFRNIALWLAALLKKHISHLQLDRHVAADDHRHVLDDLASFGRVRNALNLEIDRTSSANRSRSRDSEAVKWGHRDGLDGPLTSGGRGSEPGRVESVLTEERKWQSSSHSSFRTLSITKSTVVLVSQGCYTPNLFNVMAPVMLPVTTVFVFITSARFPIRSGDHYRRNLSITTDTAVLMAVSETNAHLLNWSRGFDGFCKALIVLATNRGKVINQRDPSSKRLMQLIFDIRF